jgi:HAD superfamily hydrolase (TIGR01509 family)
LLDNLGVLWDMDGVLVDTTEFHYRSWKQILEEDGIPLEWEQFRAVFGRNNADTLAIFLGYTPDEELVQKVGGRKEVLFRQMIRGRVEALPGVRLWLERLRSLGARQVVASSAPQENIDFLVDELDLRQYFLALCAGHTLPGKPDPTLFMQAAGILGLPPEDCIVFEDSLAGIEAARRAGMKCIAVATTNPAEALAGADMVVGRLEQLKVEDFQRLIEQT